jgi:hypothetical protein
MRVRAESVLGRGRCDGSAGTVALAPLGLRDTPRILRVAREDAFAPGLAARWVGEAAYA